VIEVNSVGKKKTGGGMVKGNWVCGGKNAAFERGALRKRKTVYSRKGDLGQKRIGGNGMCSGIPPDGSNSSGQGLCWEEFTGQPRGSKRKEKGAGLGERWGTHREGCHRPLVRERC